MRIIIFGASGDLAKRKLFPALARINTENVEIIGYARSRYDKPFTEILSDLFPYKEEFLNRIRYIQGSYDDLSGIKHLITSETSLYLSVPPTVYKTILEQLKSFEYKNVLIEKPFGNEFEDFKKFKEHDVSKMLFIDHFLLKPMFVAWPIIVGRDKKLRNVLDNKHVSSVEILFKEVIGGEGRVYFDEHGLVKDIVQNHLSELMVVSAEESKGFSCNLRAEERIEVLKSVRIIEDFSIFGQYDSYQAEMKKPSSTETYSVVTLELSNERWYGVPFITIAGKGLNEKRTEIIYNFESSAYQEVLDLVEGDSKINVESKEIQYVKLICNLAPNNIIYIEVGFENREPITYNLFDSDYIASFSYEKYGDYENHEIVFDSLSKSKNFDCVHFYEAEMLWRIYNEILRREKIVFKYSKDSDIPQEAFEMVTQIKEHYNRN